MAQTEFTVANVLRGQSDSAGAAIVKVYSRVQPSYAVYQTADRVVIQFADADAAAAAQRKQMSALNGLRMQIDGLIDGWRKSDRFREKASRYDDRVAAALILCLEGDGESATAALRDIKNDILDERTSWGRFEYLISAVCFSALVIVILAVIGYFHPDALKPPDPLKPTSISEPKSIFLALAGGVIGAFFSIALATTKRTVLTNLRRRDNIADSLLRITIGAVAALALILLLRGKLIADFKIGTTALSGDAITLDATFIIGFVAGFLERLVPDLLSKAGEPTKAAPAANQQPAKALLHEKPARARAPCVVGPIATADLPLPLNDRPKESPTGVDDFDGARHVFLHRRIP